MSAIVVIWSDASWRPVDMDSSCAVMNLPLSPEKVAIGKSAVSPIFSSRIFFF